MLRFSARLLLVNVGLLSYSSLMRMILTDRVLVKLKCLFI